MARLFLMVLLFASVFGNAQENPATVPTDESPVFSCKSVTFNEGENIFEMTGNVEFQSESLRLKGAEEVIFNTETNELVVKGWSSFILEGAIALQCDEKTKRPKILRYKLGDQIAYLE